MDPVLSCFPVVSQQSTLSDIPPSPLDPITLIQYLSIRSLDHQSTWVAAPALLARTARVTVLAVDALAAA